MPSSLTTKNENILSPELHRIPQEWLIGMSPKIEASWFYLTSENVEMKLLLTYQETIMFVRGYFPRNFSRND